MQSVWKEEKGKFLFAVCLFTCIVITTFPFVWSYVWNWKLAYSSDTALLGLMAKRIAFDGELPLFVWSVGYQGVLLDSYLAALLFRCFGVSPEVLNMAPSFYLLLGTFAWGWLIAEVFSRWTALVSVLLLGFSAPIWYQLCTRTMPNFSEIFFLSSIFLLFCFKTLQYTRKAQQVSSDSSLFATATKSLQRNAFVAAFTLGFAQYTFAIHTYFFAAVVVFFLLTQLQGCAAEGFKALAAKCIWPVRLAQQVNHPAQRQATKATSVLAAIALLVFIAGLGIFILAPEPVWYVNRRIKWNGVLLVFSSIALLGALSLFFLLFPKMQSLSQRRANFTGLKKLTLFCFGGAILGFLPALIHKIFIREGSGKSAGVSGNLPEVLDRLNTWWNFHLRVFHWNANSFLAMASVLVFTCATVFFLATHGKILKNWLTAPAIEEGAAQNAPLLPFRLIFFLLLPITTVVFLTSKASVDAASNRYLVYLVPLYTLYAATFAVTLWQKSKFGLGKLAGALVVALPIYTGYHVVKQDLHAGAKITLRQEKVLEVLLSKNLKTGYADYWLAYSTNFLTKEEIQLEPLYSNYAPHYKKIVESADRIAYVDFQPARIPVVHGEMTIQKTTYKVTNEELLPGNIVIRTLEK